MSKLTTTRPTITISGYQFGGPYENTGYLRDAAGVYAILDRRHDEQWYLIDVGESSQVKDRVENHEREECWQRSSQGTLGVAVLYTTGWSADQRRVLESTIRDSFNPPCGER